MKKSTYKYFKEKKWLQSVPNALTVCNSVMGFAAILNTLQAYNNYSNKEIVFFTSALLILLAMIFDALDGYAARILHATSLKGVQMDSLSDMVTFGVAPAVLVAVMAHVYSLTHYGYIIAWLLCVVYLATAAHRLAKYNVMTMVEKKKSEDASFYGLPSPAAAAALCSLVFLFCSTKYDPMHYYVRILPIYAGVVGILMVSKVRYKHMGKWLAKLPKSRKSIIMLIVALIFFAIYPIFTVVVVVNGYVIFGIIFDVYKRISDHRKKKNLR